MNKPPSTAAPSSASPRVRAALGLALIALGALILLASDERWLPRTRSVTRLGGLGLGLGAVLLVVGIFGWVRQRIAAAAPEQQARLRRVAIALAIAVPMVAAFATYSLGFYWKKTMRSCRDAGFADDLAARKRRLEDAEARLRSPFSLLPEIVGFRASNECASAREDIARVERGECPYSMRLPGRCRCGSETWPVARRCEHPQCVTFGNERRLRCSGDRF